MTGQPVYARWLIIGLVVAQCAFLWFGADKINERRRFLETALRVQAETIHTWEVPPRGRSSTMHHALIAFETPEGRLINAPYRTQFKFLALKDRGILEVVYKPGVPQTAMPADFLRLWFEPLLAAGFAGFFLLLGLFILWPGRKATLPQIVS